MALQLCLDVHLFSCSFLETAVVFGAFLEPFRPFINIGTILEQGRDENVMVQK
ncbi:MAG: hypothetical protein GY805_03690 [Chloroflexi bacterium]|nr:hypothetical protein [Chloroflexota bacterium]